MNHRTNRPSRPERFWSTDIEPAYAASRGWEAHLARLGLVGAAPVVETDALGDVYRLAVECGSIDRYEVGALAWKARIMAGYEAGNTLVAAVWHENRAVALHEAEIDGLHATLRYTAVHPHYRRIGLAKGVQAVAVTELRRRGVSMLWVEADRNVPLVLGLGFVPMSNPVPVP